MALWELLRIKYSNDSPNYRKAINMGAYYNGYLNTSCLVKKDGNTIL